MLDRANMLLLALAAIVLLAGSLSCQRSEASQSTPREVRLGFFANVTHAQALIGVQGGEFARAVEPLALKSKVFHAGPSLIEALFTGEIDIGYIGPGPAINAHVRSRGEGLRVLSGSAANGVLIVARPDAGIESLDDLRGRIIAIPQIGNTQDVSARHFVIEHLKQPHANNVLPVNNAEQGALMARGHIDAAWVPEPWGSRLILQQGAILLARESEFWPGEQFPLTLLVTTPRFLEAHPDVVERLLAAHVRLTEQLAVDPQAYVDQIEDAILALTGKRLPAGVVSASLDNVQFATDPMEPALQTMADRAFELQMFRRPAQIAGLIHRKAKAGEVSRVDH